MTEPAPEVTPEPSPAPVPPAPEVPAPEVLLSDGSEGPDFVDVEIQDVDTATFITPEDS